MGTNVKAEQLNYHNYPMEKYDKDILNSIPGHQEMHVAIGSILDAFPFENVRGLELGVGTGLTALNVLKRFPNADYTVIDFDNHMLNGARQKLAEYEGVAYVNGDYSSISLRGANNLVVSVIGLHHQERDVDKLKMLQKINDALMPGGYFIYGDLFEYQDRKVNAAAHAKHMHHLVNNNTELGVIDEETLQEGAHHHLYLNPLGVLEEQVRWMQNIGFSEVNILYSNCQTHLILAKKARRM